MKILKIWKNFCDWQYLEIINMYKIYPKYIGKINKISIWPIIQFLSNLFFCKSITNYFFIHKVQIFLVDLVFST